MKVQKMNRPELIAFLEGVSAGNTPGFTLWDVSHNGEITRHRHGRRVKVTPTILLKEFKAEDSLICLCDEGIESLNMPAEVNKLILQYGNTIKFYSNETSN